MKTQAKNLTLLLKSAAGGNKAALEEVFPAVYDEIRALAKRYLQKERPGHTLQPTALVNEAWIRLADGKQVDWQDREHFFAIAATVMRRVIIDHAKAKGAEKRGGGGLRVTFDEKMHWAVVDAEKLVELDETIEKLSKVDPRLAKVVELRYFGGMTVDEIGLVLGTSVATVKRDWAMAKLWLFRELSE